MPSQLGIGDNSNQTLPVEVDRSGVLAGRRIVALAQRAFGAARTGSVFAFAPFIGAVVAVAMLGQVLAADAAADAANGSRGIRSSSTGHDVLPPLGR